MTGLPAELPELKLPEVITAPEIARALGWTTQRARRWLKRSGAGRKSGAYSRAPWITTPERLRECFPEAWSAVARLRLGL